MLANYRGVCTTWDREIAKLLRKDTEINLLKILAPYPAGMGWTASPDNLEEPFRYEAPYQDIRPFESVVMIADSCESLKNQKFVNWFRIMGSDVKGLCFSSPLTCKCQNEFLERILKDWCPNLEHLELVNVKCVESLLIKSHFSENSTSFICNGFKDLTISVDGILRYTPCLEKEYTVTLYDLYFKLLSMTLNSQLVWIIYKYCRDSGSNTVFPEIVNMAGELVELTDKSLLLESRNNIPTMITGTDGGIMGKLMKAFDLEKLVVRGLDDSTQYQNLVTFFHIRPNKWRMTLKCLELDKSLSIAIPELHALVQVKFPLTTLKLGGIHENRDNIEMTRFLSYFSDTLEHLEFSGNSVREKGFRNQSALSLPVLPKLKLFVHENIGACCLTAENLWSSAPNLETCVIKNTVGNIWKSNKFFENSSSILGNTMKELAFDVKINVKRAELFLDWFPCIKKMKLVLESLGPRAYVFFGKLENSKVERLKIGFYKFVNRNGRMIESCKNAGFWKEGNIKGELYE